MKLELGKAGVKPLHEAVDAITAATLETPASALELTAILKRAESMLEDLRHNIRPQANKEFLELIEKSPETAVWPMLHGAVQVTRYSPKSYWDYPLEIVRLECALRDKQKQAQMNKTALKKTPTVNPKTDTIFSLSVLDG